MQEQAIWRFLQSVFVAGFLLLAIWRSVSYAAGSDDLVGALLFSMTMSGIVAVVPVGILATIGEASAPRRR